MVLYIEKKKVYNIEGQLRGFQGSNQAKTCAPKVRMCKMYYIKHLYPREARVKLPPSQDTLTAKQGQPTLVQKSLSATAVCKLKLCH
jgi:hypothetical protein